MTSVAQNEVMQIRFLWTRGIAARETLRYLERKGLASEPLLLKAELSRSQLLQDSGGISVASQHRLLELAALETNDSLLGLHVAAEMVDRLLEPKADKIWTSGATPTWCSGA